MLSVLSGSGIEESFVLFVGSMGTFSVRLVVDSCMCELVNDVVTITLIMPYRLALLSC